VSIATVQPRDLAVSVSAAAETDRDAWERFVDTQPGATAYHSWAWREVLARAFGHDSTYLIARRGEDIDGILPLVEVRSRLFGRSLTSMPFLNYGGVLTGSQDSRDALIAAARGLARERECRHLELRHIARQCPDVPCREHKVTMKLGIGEGQWERLDRKVRNQIRKAEKSGLTEEHGGIALLPEFYSVFARNMRDLGTPVYTRQLFAEVLAAFPDRARLHVVRLDAQPIAGGLTFRTKTMVEVPWASSRRDFNHLCPNHLLYWRILETAVADGCDVLDFGRSTPGEGTFKFKSQWGAEPVALHWEYPYLASGSLPDQGPANPKFRAAIALWKHCPLPIANALGPHIVKGIP
jgi:FemAB-related protein (PEP-CTERM system-associated)